MQTKQQAIDRISIFISDRVDYCMSLIRQGYSIKEAKEKSRTTVDKIEEFIMQELSYIKE